VLIDTNVAILVRDGDEVAAARVEGLSDPIFLSVISRVELEGGVYRDQSTAGLLRPRVDRMLEALVELPFGTAEAVAYGGIVEACGFSRTRLADRMIAATALVARVPLLTNNPRDFRDVPGLDLMEWT